MYDLISKSQISISRLSVILNEYKNISVTCLVADKENKKILCTQKMRVAALTPLGKGCTTLTGSSLKESISLNKNL